MSRIRLSVALVSALTLTVLLLVPAPGTASAGFVSDLQLVNWTTPWTWVADWLGLDRGPTVAKEGMQMDPDGTPDGSGDNKPAEDPPPAALATGGLPSVGLD